MSALTNGYWHKQTKDKPLFPDMVWSKPENRAQAGKLLIISGNATGFSVAAQAFQSANSAGAGVTRVVLPDFLRSSVPKEVLFELEFAPSVRHGSFSKKALSDLLAHANWADTVLLPGGIGRNSESSVLLEDFVAKYSGLVVIAEDALDIFMQFPEKLFNRPDTIVVADFSQLQKMWHKLTHGESALKFGMPLATFVEVLHNTTLQVASLIVTNHQDTLYVAYNGIVSTTPNSEDIWRVQTASKVAVWAMQHPKNLFESVTTALHA